MKFKQVTTIVFTQEVELTEDEAQDIIGIPEVREKEISQNWEDDILSWITGDLDNDKTLTINTKIEFGGGGADERKIKT